MAALAGALAISFSGILYRVADVSPTTGAVFRCLYAVVPLWLLARWEDRRYGPRPLRQRALAWAAGLFFAVDLVAWHQALEEVGAGLATVLGNLQVVLVALLALSSRALGWLLISMTLARLPAALTSVLLTFQPVLSVLFAWAILSESPSGLQLGGVACVLAGLLIVSAGRRQEPQAAEPGYVPAAGPQESFGS